MWEKREKRKGHNISRNIGKLAPETDEKHQSEHTGNLQPIPRRDKFRHLHLDKLVKSLKDKQNLESSTRKTIYYIYDVHSLRYTAHFSLKLLTGKPKWCRVPKECHISPSKLCKKRTPQLTSMRAILPWYQTQEDSQENYRPISFVNTQKSLTKY